MKMTSHEALYMCKLEDTLVPGHLQHILSFQTENCMLILYFPPNLTPLRIQGNRKILFYKNVEFLLINFEHLTRNWKSDH